jgi:hypothetical protein
LYVSLLIGLLIGQAQPPKESWLPPRWELEFPPDRGEPASRPYTPPPELSALIPAGDSLGAACSLRPAGEGDDGRTNPSYYGALEPGCVSLRSFLTIPLSDCGVAFYTSASGRLSAVLAHVLPTRESAQAERSRIASLHPKIVAVARDNLLAYVLDEGTRCGEELGQAVMDAAQR